MRDAKFAEVFKEEALKLEMYFKQKLRSPMPKADRAVIAEDLVQLLAIKVLKKTKENPSLEKEEIRKLIWLKAPNLVAEHANPKKRTIVPQDVEAAMHLSDNVPTALQIIDWAEDLAKVEPHCDPNALAILQKRVAGFSNEEIADEEGITEPALRKKISRLSQKIKKRWKNLGYL